MILLALKGALVVLQSADDPGSNPIIEQFLAVHLTYFGIFLLYWSNFDCCT